MRTTLNISDNVLAIARAHAERANRPIGEIISEAALKGFDTSSRENNEMKIEYVDGIPTVARVPGGRPVTPEDVRRLLDDFP